MQFVKFAITILAIFAPVVLFFASAEVFWSLFMLWILAMTIVIAIMLVRFFS